MNEAIKIDGKYERTIFTPFTGGSEVQPTTIERLREIAAESGFRLPEAYERFMLATNGAKPDPRGIAYFYTKEDVEVLKTFLSEEDEIIAQQAALVRYVVAVDHHMGGLDLSDLNRHTRSWGRSGLFGIASTNIGDIIVLDLAEGDGYGSVHYLTIHGVAALEDTGDDVPLGYIAPDFETFLSLFFDLDEILDEELDEILRQRGQSREDFGP